MPNFSENKSVEVIKHQGAKFVRINLDSIDISKMTLVHKVTDVVAAQVTNGKVKVVTRHGKEIETINYASAGDWVVYDIASSDFKNIIDKLLNSEKSCITKANFLYLYRKSDKEISLSTENIISLIQDLLMDNDDNKEFDSSFLKNLKRYKYIGKPVYASYVPFNFVLRAPWGEDQFIKRGGFVIYDTNLERQESLGAFSNERERLKHIEESRYSCFYGMEGSHNRVPGLFEKTYGVGDDKKVVADTFKLVISCDRSPIAGIQFNNVDLAKAYDRAGKELPEFLKRFLPE